MRPSRATTALPSRKAEPMRFNCGLLAEDPTHEAEMLSRSAVHVFEATDDATDAELVAIARQTFPCPDGGEIIADPRIYGDGVSYKWGADEYLYVCIN